MKTNIFCALSFCNVKSTGTLMLFCSDCSLFFQFSIISIFSPLVGFANLLFLLCVFRLVEKKKRFWTSIFLLAGAFLSGITAENVLVICLCCLIEVSKLKEELTLFSNCCSTSSSSQTSTSSIILSNFALRDRFVLFMALSLFSPTVLLLRQSRRKFISLVRS